jgi:polyisoprenoid-binding protein YceI
MCVLSVCVFAHLGAFNAHAEPLEFDFEDPKGVNAISFVLDSLVEPIIGVASGVSGTVRFDPANLEAMSGVIRVDAASLQTPQKRMQSVLHSKDWMNVDKYPTIEFVFKSIKNATPVRDNVFALEIVGDFTCRGVTRELTIPANLTYLPGKLSQRMHRGKGDLLVLRSQFSIKRSEFDINPSTPVDVVAESIELRVSIVGLNPK